MVAGLSNSAKGQVFTDLYDFAGGTGDGANPTGSLIDVGGILYGMTPGGGKSGFGTIFSFSPATDAENVLYSFEGKPADGQSPLGSLLQSSSSPSTLYGMTENGGSGSAGTLFSFNLGNNAESVLYSFGSQGLDLPTGSLIQSSGTLYGLADNAFSFNTTTNTATTLYEFGGRPDAGSGARGSLTLVGNSLYGLSESGGADSQGAMYSYNLYTNTESVVHSFTGGSDGGEPLGSPVASDGVLYGTALGGANIGGTLFSYDTSDGSFDTLFSFNGVDGGGGGAGLLADGTSLFGMSGGGANGLGCVFSYNTLTGVESLLYSFGGPDGQSPQGDLILVGNTLYGMTRLGGTNNDGVIFSIELPEPGYSLLVAWPAAWFLLRRHRGPQNISADSKLPVLPVPLEFPRLQMPPPSRRQPGKSSVAQT